MGLLFILIYFVIIFLVIEIAVVLLRSTGLQRQISRFQVISMMTGTGFTTKESELILRHPVRRKISMFLILFGAFSLAVTISSISAIMAQSFHVPQLLWTAFVLALSLITMRIPSVNGYMSKRLHDKLHHSFALQELPVRESFQMEDGDLFVDIPLHSDSAYTGKSFSELFTGGHDINLLFVKRGQDTIRKDREKIKLMSGDVLYVYGSKSDMSELFKEEFKEKTRRQRDEHTAASLNE
jgi:hypothetical protein